ncbi:MAG: 4-hydroxy-tetrahydrodipicolinate synthase [Eubacteriales bacterium]|nr:4-hydroxy-tetrahydrodipicolinate synthase [Eubacteriales bacterium]MDD3197291.1 4-hydroxy-tetrahydrodipicolinate synthase [Eubacteriales bacterium]MDD4682400.1 4-hydroxy-tetrahydrodipicolinate synthase [Eubacteriales bacterium]
MKNPVFTGSAVAIVTPFTDKGINYDKLSELCEFHIKNKTDAILVAGTTGEASTMPDAEHLSSIEHVVKTVAGRLPVIAGTGSNDTTHAVELTKRACDLGADAILSVTPYYNKCSQEGLYLHFKAIAEAVDKPIILYNVPSRTALNIAPQTYKRLSEIPNINAVKECNLDQVPDIAYLCKENLNLYTGEDPMIVPMLSLGGKGVISVAANIMPEQIHNIVSSWMAGRQDEARSIQIKLLPLIRALFSDVNPIPVKAAMNLMGMGVGPCRMPLSEPSEDSLEKIRSALKLFNLI